MSVISSLQNISGFSRINPARAGVQGLKPLAPVDDGSRADLLRAKSRLLRVYRALQNLAELADIEMRFKLDGESAISSTGLGLDLAATAAAMEPTGEINAAPNSLPPIVDGSFQLNDESISVDTTDSLNDIVDRINQSNAGVTAALNPTTERTEFLQKTTGSVPTIELLGDTSNFLRSTKLDTAVVIPGIDPDTVEKLEDVAAFSPVQSGEFFINRAPIAIDTTADNPASVIDKINASAAKVVASFDPATQKIRIERQPAAPGLELDSNGTGLFGVLLLPEGRIDGEAAGNGISRRHS